MSGSLNEATLIGNLGADPEIRSTNSGDRIASLRVATSETWRDRATGERKERTEWHRVTVYNENIVKVCEQYLRKGSKIWLRGSLQTRKWTDQAGVEKFSTEVVLQKFRGELTMLDGRSEGGGERPGRSDNRGGGSSGGYDGGQDFDADLDSQIPFITSASIR